MLMRVSALLQGWVAQAAEQLNPQTVGQRVCEHLKQTIAGIAPPPESRLIQNHAQRIGQLRFLGSLVYPGQPPFHALPGDPHFSENRRGLPGPFFARVADQPASGFKEHDDHPKAMTTPSVARTQQANVERDSSAAKGEGAPGFNAGPRRLGARGPCEVTPPSPTWPDCAACRRRSRARAQRGRREVAEV